MSKERYLTADRLRELLDYDAETGRLLWRHSPRNGIPSGSPAGTGGTRRYSDVVIDGLTFRAHRLVWLHCNGAWPKKRLDHINGQRHDNRLSNLREVSCVENAQNQRRAHSNNRTGLLGVITHKKRFRARIVVAGKKVYLGTFDTAIAAHAAYIVAKRELHAGCTI